jgi:chromosome partitioning protein
VKTITILNSKGGVGKTTLAVTLAAGLAATGQKVVLVDADPQGNVAKWFGMAEESGIYDLLIKERPVDELLRLVPVEQWWPGETAGVLVILPGNFRTTTAGVALALNQTPADALKRGLEPLAQAVDFVVLDTAPTVTELMANIFRASDLAVIPTETRVLSVNGVIKTMDRVEMVQDQVALRVIGIQPTKHVGRQVECQENLKTLNGLYDGLVWPPMTERAAWSEAPAYGKSIFAYAPRQHKATREAALFVKTCAEAIQGGSNERHTAR